MSPLPPLAPVGPLWDDDPYTSRRTAAVRWLGERWLLAQPLKRLDRRPDDGKPRIR